MGVKQCTVSQWELGTAQPNTDTIRKLCFLLNCSSDELLGIETNREPA
jgi:transcriptional regulator with XRE-family HTH domain